ncbi:GPI ethanolamine phosphate transferase 2 [Aphelenchoides fujianensis]|nr:GPI ethanolamine phosphate transferase 2 [Aphelenchoides fujianensis]
MFPEGIFMPRSEGTSSFFVKDYTEVDTNITRHLPSELSNGKKDWDILLLHYLGLDHIGHSLGGRDPQLHVKLGEMDGVIDGIWRNLTANNHNEGAHLVRGDGRSRDDVRRRPRRLLRTGVLCARDHPHDRPAGVRPPDRRRTIEQVDLVPTISFMLNLSLPSKSVGVGFERRFVDDTRRLWENLERNALQFHQLALSNRGPLLQTGLGRSRGLHANQDGGRVLQVLGSPEGRPVVLLVFEREPRHALHWKWSRPVRSDNVLPAGLDVEGRAEECESPLDRPPAPDLPLLLQLHRGGTRLVVCSANRALHRSSFRYFMFASLLFYELYVGVWDAKSRKVNTKHVELLLAAIVLHRIARFPSELHRRRWALDDEFGILNWDFDYVPADTHYLQVFSIACVSLFLLCRWTAASILLVVRYFPKGIVWKGGRVSDLVTATAALVVLGTKMEALSARIRRPFGRSVDLFCSPTGCAASWCGSCSSSIPPTTRSASFVRRSAGSSVEWSERIESGVPLSSSPPSPLPSSTPAGATRWTRSTWRPATRASPPTCRWWSAVRCSLNAYMGPVNVLIGWKHTNHAAVDLSLLVNVVALRSSALLCTTINLFHQRSHLFNWRVFAPKLLVEGLHFLVVCAWIGAECFFLFGR